MTKFLIFHFVPPLKFDIIWDSFSNTQWETKLGLLLALLELFSSQVQSYLWNFGLYKYVSNVVVTLLVHSIPVVLAWLFLSTLSSGVWAGHTGCQRHKISSLAHWKYLTAPRCQVCRIPEGRRYSKVITTESVRQESKKTRACLSVLNADTAVSYCLQSGRTSDTLSLKSEGCHAWRSGVWSGLKRCLDPCTCCSILPAMRWLCAVLYQEHTVTSSEPVEYGSKPVALINNKKI